MSATRGTSANADGSITQKTLAELGIQSTNFTVVEKKLHSTGVYLSRGNDLQTNSIPSHLKSPSFSSSASRSPMMLAAPIQLSVLPPSSTDFI